MISKSKLLVVLCVFALIWGCVSTTTTTGSTMGTEVVETDKARAAMEYYQLGAQYFHNGSYELARDRLKRALEFDPKMAAAHSTLAMTYVRLENPRLAIQHYQEAVKVEPKNFDVRNAYAVYLCQEQKFDDARKQFDQAIAVYDNDNAEIMLTNAGVCMSNKPDYDLAEQYFRQALEFKSSYGEALIQLSALKHKTGNDLHARAFFQRYLINNSPSAPVLYLGYEIEKALGDDRASSDYSNQLFRDFPDSAESRYLSELR